MASLDQLKQLVEQGVPVIVDWFSVDDGHYAVVVGIDDEGVRLMDPELGKDRVIDAESFQRRWFDFNDLDTYTGLIRRQAIVVLPPGV